MLGCTEKIAICKPKKEASGEANPANILDTGLLGSRLRTFLLFKPPSLWYFAMITIANKCTASYLWASCGML
jgi:hypothetical protein